MTLSQIDFAKGHYAPRAADYVASAVHAAGPDLDQIGAIVAETPEVRLLDLGCGGGHVSYRAAENGARVTACDPTRAMLEAVAQTAKERGLDAIETCEAAAEGLPFADGSFGIVVSRFSAHHWADLAAGVREAFRVLKPGGRAVFIDTTAPENVLLDTHLQTLELLRDPSHVRNYRISEWIACVGEAGFVIDGVTTRRLAIEFKSWVARTRTALSDVASLQAMMQRAPDNFRRHFSIADNCDFSLLATTFILSRPVA